jgi:hypothetical protein
MDHNRGLLHLLANEVIAQGGTVLADMGRAPTYVFRFREEIIITPVPNAVWLWERLVGDLVRAGLHWPPPLGG